MACTTDQAFEHQPGRYYAVVSIPVDHPQANGRSELVRGNYESVEMIRELPIIKPKNTSKDKDSKKSNKEAKETPGNDEEDPERNPVEWLMITRSDPGGGIPRFMVERNTPPSITADAKKFVDWAAKGDNIPSDEKIEELKKEADIDESETPAAPAANGGSAPIAKKRDPQELGTDESLTARYEPHDKSRDAGAASGGILASLSSAAATLGSSMQAGYEAYAPNMPAALGGSGGTNRFANDTSSDSDSISSFESAQDYAAGDARHHQHQTAQAASSDSVAVVDQDPLSAQSSRTHLITPAQPAATVSTPNLPSTERPRSPSLSDSSSIMSSRRKLSSHEKELQKVIAKRRSMAEKFSLQEAKDKQRQEEIAERATRDSEKQKAKLEKERQKNQDKYHKEMAKLEERQRREEKKLERKRLKEENGETIVRLGREADDLRAENELLKNQMARVQREMTVLQRELGNIPGGPEVLARVQAEHQVAGDVGVAVNGAAPSTAV